MPTYITPYNQIEHSARIRHISDGQREGLHRIKFGIYGTPFLHIFNIIWICIQLFADIFKYLKIVSNHWKISSNNWRNIQYLKIWRYLQILNICYNSVPNIKTLFLVTPLTVYHWCDVSLQSVQFGCTVFIWLFYLDKRQKTKMTKKHCQFQTDLKLKTVSLHEHLH